MKVIAGEHYTFTHIVKQESIVAKSNKASHPSLRVKEGKSSPYIRPYFGQLLPDARKSGYLKKTFEFLEHGSEVFFEFFMSFLGGITEEMLKKNQQPHVDYQLVCAINWFRIVKKDESNPILPPLKVISKFSEYYGQSPTGATLEYLSAMVNADIYQWIDCKARFEVLSKFLGVSTLHRDLMSLIEEKSLPVVPEFEDEETDSKKRKKNKKDVAQTGVKLAKVSTDINSWNMCSILFGEGEKEDRDVKVKISQGVCDLLTQNPPSTQEEFAEAVLKLSNVQTSEEFYRIYAGDSSGRPNTIVKLVNGSKPYNDESIKSTIVKVKKTIKDKSKKLDLPNRLFIKRYINEFLAQEGVPGTNYRQDSWSEMMKSALTDILVKNKRNYNFSYEQLLRREELNQIGESNVLCRDALNAFFSSPEYKSEEDNEYVIVQHHLGDLELLFEIWSKLDSDESLTEDQRREEGLDQFFSMFDGKQPIRALLRYVYSLRELYTAQNFKEATRFNSIQNRLKNQNVNPTVKGNLAFTFSYNGNGSSLKGKLVHPSNLEQKYQKDSHHMIWLELNMIDESGDWNRHHIPFHNAHLMTEVVRWNQDSTIPPVTLRHKRYGFNPSTNHLKSADKAELVKTSDIQHRKAAKTLVRSLGSNVPNVIWNEKSASICISRFGDKYRYTVNFKINHNERKSKSKCINVANLSIGDMLMGYDQNQTSLHTYGIGEVVSANHIGATPYRGIYLKMVETGYVTSEVKTATGKVIDQLSYKGLSGEDLLNARCPEIRNWVGDCRNYIHSLGSSIYDEQFANLDERLNEMIEGRRLGLYAFNWNYTTLLLKIIKGNLKVAPEKGKKTVSVNIPLPEGIRQEIDRLIYGKASIMRLSSLDWTSIKALKSLRSLVHSYFGKLIPKGENTDKAKEDLDPELFAFLTKISKKITDKCEEKISRAYDFICNKALSSKRIRFLIGEANLPVATTGKSKAVNSAAMDWCARGLYNKLAMSDLYIHKVTFIGINPLETSHQDAMSHRSDRYGENKKMFARFSSCLPEYIDEWTLNKLSNYLQSNKDIGTAPYYRQAAKDFLQHYGIEEYESALIRKKVPLEEFRQVLAQRLVELGETEVIFPRRGGRIYLCTSNVTLKGTPFVYNGRSCFISNADLVAAVNIFLTAIYVEKEEASALVPQKVS